MKVGRSHKWYYDKGEWKEKKITPDKWEFSYVVTAKFPRVITHEKRLKEVDKELDHFLKQ